MQMYFNYVLPNLPKVCTYVCQVYKIPIHTSLTYFYNAEFYKPQLCTRYNIPVTFNLSLT